MKIWGKFPIAYKKDWIKGNVGIFQNIVWTLSQVSDL
jgi:hypothetical protein